MSGPLTTVGVNLLTPSMIGPELTSSKSMNTSVLDVKKILLEEGQKLTVEPSAMLAYKNLTIETGMQGSLFSVASRYLFGGETLFQNTYTAGKGGGWIAFEEGLQGQILPYKLKPGVSLTMGKGAFVAADSNVKVTTSYGGISAWLQGVGLVKQKAMLESGAEGRIFFGTAKGLIKELSIKSEDGCVITDNDNTVAYSGELNVKVRRPGGIFSTLLSGEGLVNEFRGTGSIFLGSGEKEVTHNLFEQVVKAFTDSCIPSRVVVVGLLAVYIIFNSNVAVKGVELGMNMFRKS